MMRSEESVSDGQDNQDPQLTLLPAEMVDEGLGSQLRQLTISSEGMDGTSNGGLNHQEHKRILIDGLDHQGHKGILNDGRDHHKPNATILREKLLNVSEEQRRLSAGLESKRQYITTPCEGVSNDGRDNQENDLILYTDCILENSFSSRKYIVKSMLGQGSFGQVCRCSTSERDEDVAVKIVKNSPAYNRQAVNEIGICCHLNNYDRNDEGRIVRILDYFEFAGHICMVFELLSESLYDLLKATNHRGLALWLVRLLTKQMLDGLLALQGAGVIHCDLKPENILLEPMLKGEKLIKLIDFGTSCMETLVGRDRFTYIQSRHYRSPEVLLKMSYTRAIDIWSVGCIAAELFLGIQLFPGECEYDLFRLMIEILGGQPPDHMIRSHHANKDNFKFFKLISAAAGSLSKQMAMEGGQGSAYQFLTAAEVAARESERQGVAREWEKSKVKRRIFFQDKKLAEIVMEKPISSQKMTSEDMDKEMNTRIAFVDFLTGLLHFDPTKRWTPRQALLHPFISGEYYLSPFEPPPERLSFQSSYARRKGGIVLDHTGHSGRHWLSLSPQMAQLFMGQMYSPNPGYHLHGANNSFNGSPGSHGREFFSDGHVLGSSYGSFVDVNGVGSHVDATGVGTSPGSYGNYSPIPRFADGLGQGSNSGSDGEPSRGMGSFHPSTLNTGVNGGFPDTESLGFGGGFGGGLGGSRTVLHRRANYPNHSQTVVDTSSSNYHQMPLGFMTPPHSCNSPNSSAFQSPMSSSYHSSPWYSASPSSILPSPSSHLTSSPGTCMPQYSPSRFGHSPYRLGGSAPKNIPSHTRHRSYGSENPHLHFTSAHNPNANENGHDSGPKFSASHASHRQQLKYLRQQEQPAQQQQQQQHSQKQQQQQQHSQKQQQQFLQNQQPHLQDQQPQYFHSQHHHPHDLHPPHPQHPPSGVQSVHANGYMANGPMTNGYMTHSHDSAMEGPAYHVFHQPEVQWPSDRKANTDGNDFRMRNPATYSSSFPPRHTGVPLVPHIASAAQPLSLPDQSLAAILRMPQTVYKECSSTPRIPVPGFIDEQSRAHPADTASSSNTTTMDRYEASDDTRGHSGP